jgi:hypothetical protein
VQGKECRFNGIIKKVSVDGFSESPSHTNGALILKGRIWLVPFSPFRFVILTTLKLLHTATQLVKVTATI